MKIKNKNIYTKIIDILYIIDFDINIGGYIMRTRRSNYPKPTFKKQCEYRFKCMY